RVHQRHRCALGKLLSREPVELLPGEGLVSVSHPVLLLSVGLGATPRSRAAGARRATGESQTWLRAWGASRRRCARAPSGRRRASRDACASEPSTWASPCRSPSFLICPLLVVVRRL